MKKLNISSPLNAARISLLVGFIMFALKLGGYIITGSAAIFSDAAESVVHIFATGMALYSIILSAKPADKSHLYGHSNVEFFSAGVEGMLIIIAALYIIFESVMDIIYGSELQSLNTGIIIVGIAGAGNLALGIFLTKIGKKNNSIVLIADGKHVLTDSFTSLGVLVGITLVLFTGAEILDPLFAIGVAINILFTGYALVRQSVKGLMKETNDETLEKIVNCLSSNRKDYWIDIHELRFWESGNKLFIDFHMILPYYFTIKESHTEENRIEDLLLQVFPSSQLKIHFDYCKPDLCKYCRYEECTFRSELNTVSSEWDINKLIGAPVYKTEIKSP